MYFKLGPPIDKTVILTIDANATISQVKHSLSKITLIPAECTQIKFNDAVLKQNKKVKSIKSSEEQPLICDFYFIKGDNPKDLNEPPPDFVRKVEFIANMGFNVRDVYAALVQENYDMEQALSTLQTKSVIKTPNIPDTEEVPKLTLEENIEPQETNKQIDLNYIASRVSDLITTTSSNEPVLTITDELPNIEDITDFKQLIRHLNAHLPDYTLDSKALVKEFREKNGDFDELAASFPGFTKGYLNWVLNTIGRKMAGRLSNPTKWTVDEERFLLEMYHLGVVGKKVDLALNKKPNESTHKWKSIRKFLNNTHLLECFTSGAPNCSIFDAVYDEHGLPRYLINLCNIIKFNGVITQDTAWKLRDKIQGPEKIDGAHFFTKPAQNPSVITTNPPPPPPPAAAEAEPKKEIKEAKVTTIEIPIQKNQI
ncbi:hypothetical protein TVAG_331640 [Trichomonas vaginalis G3]|uniref:UBA domain-containing protein n=1 Tax=Trichomonas vaginalis (strain ATCC PRA-98 / G3) TaxID=412133 RepID=A2G315_TRIV3|nr:UBA-like family [Trichomonas vaginalis G3]EAX88448.1 hypothetical protein TVAG_331640 [Trichomonas vaginalis G3]KAI5507070.1 UBA-like family [Trichomonas vaginalis G3]|eukprot:XP_001301378.1 hypothetical protein [Trichomonas vaginalis G3]